MNKVGPSLRVKPMRRGEIVVRTMVPSASHRGRYWRRPGVVVNTPTHLERLAAQEKHAPLDLAVPSEVYCRYCHLAAPRWRKKCIHCAQLLHI